MPFVICIANQKGGIGKTTTATTLASILCRLGKKTLLIDADPQCNSTDTYRASVHQTATLFDVVLDNDPISLNDAVQHTPIGDIVASDPLLKEADTRFPSDGEEYFRLKDAIDSLKGYDYVVIDTAPSDNKLLKNCIVSADKIVIPLTADRYSISGLAELHKTIAIQKKRNNPALEIAGLLLVKFNPRQKLAQEVKNALDVIAVQQMDTKVFSTFIRQSIAVQQAQAARMNLIDFAPKSPAACDYQAFVHELLELKGEV